MSPSMLAALVIAATLIQDVKMMPGQRFKRGKRLSLLCLWNVLNITLSHTDATCPNVNNRGVPAEKWSEDGTELDGEGDKCYKYERIEHFLHIYLIDQGQHLH